jgi:hypothetical protein
VLPKRPDLDCPLAAVPRNAAFSVKLGQGVAIRRRTVDQFSMIQSWEPATLTVSACGN